MASGRIQPGRRACEVLPRLSIVEELIYRLSGQASSQSPSGSNLRERLTSSRYLTDFWASFWHSCFPSHSSNALVKKRTLHWRVGANQLLLLWKKSIEKPARNEVRYLRITSTSDACCMPSRKPSRNDPVWLQPRYTPSALWDTPLKATTFITRRSF
jgi:hypothetical protein